MGSSSNLLIYLASASPRRSALLDQIGVAHRVQPVDVDERARTSEPPDQYVRRLAVLKAETLWQQLPSAERQPVLGADTAVVLDAEILGKPRDEQDCLRMLGLLSARTHQVFTAVALKASADCEARVNVSEVTFRRLAAEEIRRYWHSGEPADKAGGYAVQGRAALFIERIAGSYSGIMGLPLFETGELLAAIGARG
ncbi:MAG TPA: Maf family protein [Steroidobacteraceae bacterium]|nr:Maf family protein [Steroidobacteraceae bacterium]